GIAQRESRDPNLRYGVLDPACFKEDGGPSIAERINKELIAARLRPFYAAGNFRVPHSGAMGGWGQLRSRPVGQGGKPMIHCFSTHADSIRTIPALQHDPARPEDVNTESRITPVTNGGMRACRGRSCECPWHVRGVCQTWDTSHTALPRRVTGSSTDGRGRKRRLDDFKPA